MRPLDALKSVCAATIAISAVLLVSKPTAAEDATREKCTCNLGKGGRQENGAWVQNATACWLTTDPSRNWCDIAVQGLEGTETSSAVVQTLFQYRNDGPSLVKTFQDQFERFISSPTPNSIGLDRQAAEKVVPSLLAEKQQQIGQCVDAFRDAAFGKGSVTIDGGKEFRCSVGQSSGWLRIEFRVDEFWLIYLLAPNG